MQHDELIWSNIGNKSFCAFKVNAKTLNTNKFCKHEMNLTGEYLKFVQNSNRTYIVKNSQNFQLSTEFVCFFRICIISELCVK